MAQHLRNIKLKTYRKFLESQGCKCIRTKGGHEHWARSDLSRSLTLQTHISPVPQFIIQQHLRYLEIDKNKFLEIIGKL